MGMPGAIGGMASGHPEIAAMSGGVPGILAGLIGGAFDSHHHTKPQGGVPNPMSGGGPQGGLSPGGGIGGMPPGMLQMLMQMMGQGR